MSIQKNLHELDDEIELRRQQINVLRVEIAQIEEARRTQLWLVEDRQHRLAHPPLKREQMQVVVRDRQPQIANGAAHDVIEEGREKARSHHGSDKPRDYAREWDMRKAREEAKKPRKDNPDTAATQMRDKVIGLLTVRGPMMTSEISRALGIPGNWRNKKGPHKQMSNAIYMLARQGRLERNDDDMTYRLK